MRFSLTALAVSAILITGCSNQGINTMTQPSQIDIAQQARTDSKKVPRLENHGDTRIDNYYGWETTNVKMWKFCSTRARKPIRWCCFKSCDTAKTAVEELKGRIAKDDSSVPVKEGNFYYSNQVSGDNEYAIYRRAKDFAGTDSEVLLDANELAKEHEFFNVGGLYVSPNESLMAYGEDTLSRRVYTIRIKNLDTGDT